MLILLTSEIVKFRAMLEDKINAKETPLSVFPEEYKPLIAKLAHERSVLLTMWHHSF